MINRCKIHLHETEYVKMTQRVLDIELRKKFEGMEFRDFYELNQICRIWGTTHEVNSTKKDLSELIIPRGHQWKCSNDGSCQHRLSHMPSASQEKSGLKEESSSFQHTGLAHIWRLHDRGNIWFPHQREIHHFSPRPSSTN